MRRTNVTIQQLAHVILVKGRRLLEIPSRTLSLVSADGIEVKEDVGLENCSQERKTFIFNVTKANSTVRDIQTLAIQVHISKQVIEVLSMFLIYTRQASKKICYARKWLDSPFVNNPFLRNLKLAHCDPLLSQ